MSNADFRIDRSVSSVPAGCGPSRPVGRRHGRATPWHRATLPLIMIVAVSLPLPSSAGDALPPVTVRVTWGGGEPKAWSGSVRLGGGARVERFLPLSCDQDANASLHVDGGTIAVHAASPRRFDGFDVIIQGWENGSLAIDLGGGGGTTAAAKLEVPIVELLSGSRQQPLDSQGNRVVVRRAPGDTIQVRFHETATDGAGPRGHAVRKPGEVVRMWVRPVIEARASSATDHELRLRLTAGGRQVFTGSSAIVRLDGDAGLLAPLAEIPVDVPLPTREGPCDVQFELVERGSLRWSRSIASRTVQMVTVAATPATESMGAMEVVYELDPGSPRLLDRLRRLPGVSVPQVPVPPIPMPSIRAPQLPLTGVPSLPRFPAVESLLPRSGGLLSVGSSTLEVHALGPVLRLPPAPSSDELSWEGIAIPVARPGIPHVVEVEYPTDQESAVAVAVVEPTAAAAGSPAGGLVSCEGGFRVKPAAFGAEPARMDVHRLVFWPKTRSPVVVLVNPSTRRPAVVGKVRVLAGPERLPASDRGPDLVAAAGRRSVHGFLPIPDFSRFGVSGRIDPESGAAIHDWETFFVGVTRCAERLRSQGADGGMLCVYADGAAVWPMAQAATGLRWDGGAFDERGADPERKNVVDLVCRVFEREGLGFVAAVECAGPLGRLEAAIARGGDDVAGLECVGRDGRPVAIAAGRRGRHYNILDPRVQDAVAAIVGDLAGVLGGSRAARGVAVLLGHDGWMHLPGVASPLDDTTMERFSRATGIEVPREGAGRFAARASLVEGPAREAWLDWRGGEIAAFHARLADVVRAGRPSLELHVALTTLLSDGPAAARFRPVLSAEEVAQDLLPEFGIDPTRIASHAGVVFVSPHVRGAGEDLVAEAALDRGNGSLSVLRRYAPVSRRGTILIERPLEAEMRGVSRTLGLAASADGSTMVPLHIVPAGAERVRPLAASLVASDLERVFDASLLLDDAPPRAVEAMRAFRSLPSAKLETLDRLPAPLVVRAASGDRSSWVALVNASSANCTATFSSTGDVVTVVDAVGGQPFERREEGGRPSWSVPLAPWEIRSLETTGAGTIGQVAVSHDDPTRAAIAARLASLRRRRASLESPTPLEVLDNPAFELDMAGGAIPGWELVEPARGSAEVVPSGGSRGGQAVRLASQHGLSTLQSNPFAAPPTGRLSVAAWLRLDGDSPQPPLRIAVEGREGDRQYYRFAPIGGGPGAMPLKAEWSQVVLQIDDFPTAGIEQVRVRFDLLGPGGVQIDDVRVFDLAFEESQRVQLSKTLAMVDHHLASGEVGACVVELEGHWPRFLMDFVEEKAAEATADSEPAAGRDVPDKAGPVRNGVLERMRRWWQ